MFHQYYEEIIHYLLRGTCWKGATDVERNTISRRAAKYKVINGVLYHKGKGRGIEDFRLVATTVADQQNAIRMCHISEVDDQHFGINKTASLLASRYYWRMMYTDVIKYIEKCHKCQSQKVVVPLQVNMRDERMCVWRMLEVDVLDRFIISGKKYQHLLRLADVHSSWTTFVVLEDSSERAAVRALFKECSVLGFPLAFRFVRPSGDYSCINSFISALHQELDGFSSVSCDQPVDTSVHVAMEDDNSSWSRERCVQSCQEVIIENPSALYIFFGCHFLVDQKVRDWYSEKVHQFIKDEPFWWPQRLSSFLFHLRNVVPPGMTSSPSALLSSGARDENPIFMPLLPEPVLEKEELVACMAPKEYLAQSCFISGKVQKTEVIKPVSNKTIKETVLPVNNKNASKRKPESGKSGVPTSKRPHPSSKPSSSSIPVRSEEAQKKVDEGILEALDEVISKGLKDIERQKKKKKRSSKKDNNHSSTGMFEMSGDLVSARSHAPGLDMAMKGSMSSLEALKAVTGSSIPPSVPPLLPSAILSPTTPEGDSPAPPHEEASPGRYSFRQNLKPKGPSNFIKRLIAKTSSKRFTGIPEITELQPNWPVFPPKKVSPKPPLKSLPPPPPPTKPQPAPAPQPAEPVVPVSHSPVLNTQLSEDLLHTDFEPNCNLGLSKAEEDLIDQTIKGVDQNGFMDPVKYVGDDVLTVEDISKEDLSSMEVSDSDMPIVPNALSGHVLNSVADRRTDFEVVKASINSLTNQKSGISTDTNLSDFDSLKESSELDVNVGIGIPETQSSDLNSRRDSASSNMDTTEQKLILEDSNDSDDVAGNDMSQTEFETAFVTDEPVESSYVTDGTVEEMDTSVPEHVEICSVSAEDVNSFDTELSHVQVVDANSAVIYDVLDTCATFEVGDKRSSIDISDHVNEDDIELVTEKISQDLASGLTIDKTKTAQGQLNNALTEEESIVASACNALLNMATATNFSVAVNNTTCSVQVPVTNCTTNLTSDMTFQTECDRTDSPLASNDCVTGVAQQPVHDESILPDIDVKIELSESQDTSMEMPIVAAPVEEAAEVKDEVCERDFESELCLPSDFFLDEELLESPEKKSEVKSVKKSASQNKLMADQDIVSILNSIMSNRAFMDDPVARAQREKLDRELKSVHGLTKDVKIDVSPIADPVVQRAVLGPVPVRTIRTNDRRAYYIGNVKMDEYKSPVVQPVSTSPIVSVTVPMGGGKSAQVFLPKSALPMQAVKKFQTILKPPPARPIVQAEIVKPKPFVDPAIIRKPKKPLGCPICPRTYAICQEMLDLHVTFHIDNARNLHCPVCGRAATVWTNILKHYAGHPEAKDNASLYEMILATIDKDRKLCGQCNTLFAMRNALIQHLQTSHTGEKSNKNIQVRLLETVLIKKDVPVPDRSVGIKSTSIDAKDINYLCPYCPYSTKTHYNLILHSHECQGKPQQKLGDPISKVLEDLSPQVKCSLCKFAGVSSKQLEQHMRLQHGKLADLKHCCDFCPLKFKTVDQLKCHLLKHKEVTTFYCKVCSYKCRYKKIMHRHFNKIHPDVPMKGMILAPKKLKNTTILRLKGDCGDDSKDSDDDKSSGHENEEENEDTGIPTATVVVHTDENGELMVCDEDDASNIPLEPEETFVYDPNVTDANTVTIEGSAVTLDGNAVTIDGNAVTLDGNAVTLDGNVLQILQGDSVDYNGQPKVLYLSVGPQEIESFSSSTFTFAEEGNNS